MRTLYYKVEVTRSRFDEQSQTKVFNVKVIVDGIAAGISYDEIACRDAKAMMRKASGMQKRLDASSVYHAEILEIIET